MSTRKKAVPVSKKKPAASKKQTKASTPAKPRPVDADIGVFMAGLEHPLKTEIETVRTIILGVSPEIGEAVKWNAPSFRTTEFFATVNLRSQERVQLIFHLGAKVRQDLTEVTFADPAGLVHWLAKDRCSIVLGTGADIAARRTAFENIVQQWIAYV